MAKATHTNGNHGHAEHHGGHHIIPIWSLFKTFVALVILMFATIAWAQITYLLPFHTAPWFAYMNNGVALTIAVVKAVLVINIFMGVKFGSNLLKTFAILGFAWASILFLVFADYATRRLEPVQGWIKDSPLAMPRAAMPYENVMPDRKDIVIPKKEKGAKAKGKKEADTSSK